MASRQDLELAKRLLSARILSEDAMRGAYALLGQLAEQGKQASLEAVLYHQGLLPRGSLAVLRQPPPLEAQPFLNYRLESVLGEGGSGVVYLATYLPNGSPVAVKVLDAIQALRPDFLERFQHEARVLIELEHEHIVQGYEVGFEQGRHFVSMDYIDGMTVLDVIDRRGHLENEEALSITLQCARALEYLHDSGFLHRDIKPGNIMVDAEGHARMIDLGLIRAMPKDGVEVEEEDEQMTVGTVEYLSPEQARGRADLDPRSDIYSLGVSLYHMVVGEVPFQGENDYETMAKQVLSALDTQKVKTRRVAPEVHFMITKMTSKDRDMRFESVQEVLATIGGYVPAEPVPVDFGEAPVAQPIAPPASPVGRPPAVPPAAPPVAPPVAAPVRPVAAPRSPAEPPPVAKPVAAPVAKPVAAPVAKPVTPAGPPRAARPITPSERGGGGGADAPSAAPPPLPPTPPAPSPQTPAEPPPQAPAGPPPAAPASPAEAPKKTRPAAPIPKRRRKRR